MRNLEHSIPNYKSLLGDYKVTGRDSLVFLVDASKEMFIKGENGEPSNFDITMQVCRWPVLLCLCYALSILLYNNYSIRYVHNA